MKQGKQSTILPSRSGLQALTKSEKTINDYSKATPVTAETPNLIQNLRQGK
jgi:hypothetical protein